MKTLVTIRRERLLPRTGEVTMRIGQQVTPVQIVARTVDQPRYMVLHASKVLGVPPGDISRYLLVEEGATLSKGTPVLRKPGSLGRGKLFNAPVDGILYHIHNGRLVIQLPQEAIELRAMVRGYINNIVAHRGVTLEITGTLIQALWGSGKEGVGKLKAGSRDEHGEFSLNTLDKEAHGAVMVAGMVTEGSALQAMEQHGVRGLIVGSMSAGLCAAATKLEIPVILTDGIGAQGMARPIFKLLQESEGRETTLFAQVNSQNGERPEIIIPLPANTNPSQPALPGVKLELGQTVRLIRAPYTGQIGKVSRLYDRARNSAIGLRVAGADVTLPDGQVVYVPYTNLDLLA